MIIYTKICTKCKITKPITEFHKDKRLKDGVVRRCKICKKKYYQDNKKDILEQKKEYHQNNKEANNARSQQYYQDNKEQIIERQNKYAKKRRVNDPLFTLTERIRSRINESLRKNGYSKTSRTHEILGCSYDYFKVHIENQFAEGMSWDNRSEWHLDHITPLSWGTTEEEIIALNHYTNFQPLWAVDNIRKRNKFSG